VSYVCVFVFCVFFSSNQIPTADNELLYLQGSASLKGLHVLQESFAAGALDPYQIITIATTNNNDDEESYGHDQQGMHSYGVFTSKYFDAESALIKQLLLDNAPTFIDEQSITALSFFRGSFVSFEQAVAFYNTSSGEYMGSSAVNYRAKMLGRMSSIGSAALITIETTVSPNTQAIVPFILNVRSLLRKTCSSQSNSGSSTTLEATDELGACYLFGGYVLSYDVQTMVYRLVPFIILGTVLVVVVVVGSSFGSVFLIIRLAITVIMSLATTYGMLVRNRKKEGQLLSQYTF
jgi:hypothetical protein